MKTYRVEKTSVKYVYVKADSPRQAIGLVARDYFSLLQDVDSVPAGDLEAFEEEVPSYEMYWDDKAQEWLYPGEETS